MYQPVFRLAPGLVLLGAQLLVARDNGGEALLVKANGWKLCVLAISRT